MYKLDLLKFDPLAYILILAVLVFEVYATFLRSPDVEALLRRSDTAYKAAVLGGSDDKGILQQIVRQNEIERDLLKAALVACSR